MNSVSVFLLLLASVFVATRSEEWDMVDVAVEPDQALGFLSAVVTESDSSESLCIYLDHITTCNGCMNYESYSFTDLSLYNATAWCVSSGECLGFNTSYGSAYNNASYTEKICGGDCRISLVKRVRDCPLESEALNIPALAFSFVLFVLCPLCILSGCVYFLALRCRANNKIAIDDDPVPVVVHVSAGHHIGGDAVMATAQFMDAHGRYDSLSHSDGAGTASPAVAVSSQAVGRAHNYASIPTATEVQMVRPTVTYARSV